jgi:fructose-bisphosphate aldolase class 1
MSQDLESIAARSVADGKGILAADESVATLTRRFDPLGQSRIRWSRPKIRAASPPTGRAATRDLAGPLGRRICSRKEALE